MQVSKSAPEWQELASGTPETGWRSRTTSRRDTVFHSVYIHALHKPAAAVDKFDSLVSRKYKDGVSCEVGR